MCYRSADDEGYEYGCLSITTDYSNVTLDMSQGYDYQTAGYDITLHNHVMDLIERNTRWRFDDDARRGLVEAGNSSGLTRRELHVQMMPFRSFLEQSWPENSPNLGAVFRDLGMTMGALVLMDMISFNSSGEIKRAIYGDQRWFLDMFYNATQDDMTEAEFNLGAVTIVTRMAQLFPELDDCYNDDHYMNRSVGSGHSMGVRRLAVTDPQLLEIVKFINDNADRGWKTFRYSSQLPLTTPQLVSMSGVLQQAFEMVKRRAIGDSPLGITLGLSTIKSKKDLEELAA